MERSALKELYIDELRDIFDAENRLVKALPKLAKAATSDQLRTGFEEHLEQTKGHVERLTEIFDALGEKPTGKKCPAMMGLVKEGEETMDEDFEGEIMDAALIAAAQRVEHYEIAAYGCVRTWADLLGETEASELLEKTLEEEKETDAKLTELAEAMTVDDSSEEEEDKDQKSTSKARGAKA
jgi:ferritin-like metal-binding protein YciE